MLFVDMDDSTCGMTVKRRDIFCLSTFVSLFLNFYNRRVEDFELHFLFFFSVYHKGVYWNRHLYWWWQKWLGDTQNICQSLECLLSHSWIRRQHISVRYPWDVVSSFYGGDEKQCLCPHVNWEYLSLLGIPAWVLLWLLILASFKCGFNYNSNGSTKCVYMNFIFLKKDSASLNIVKSRFNSISPWTTCQHSQWKYSLYS